MVKSKMLCSFICLLSVVLAAEAVAKPSPGEVAKAMVKALKDTRGGVGQVATLETFGKMKGERQALFTTTMKEATEVAIETTGEAVTDWQKMQVGIDIVGWLLARGPMTKQKAAMYVARYRTVDRATIVKWREAEGKSAQIGNSPTLTMSAIVFQEFLWNGASWRSGNPEQAIARLSSLSKDAVSRWDSVAKKSGSHVYGAWTLLAVDDLYVNDEFQQTVFNAAFPIAKR